MAKGRTGAFCEYVAFRTFCAAVNAVPYPVAASAARSLGSLLVRVFGFQRRRTLSRIRSVFPEKSEKEALEIAVRSLQNVLLDGVEMIRAPRMDRAWMDVHVKDGALYRGKLQAYVDEGRGVVIMVPHAANWYMAAWSMAKYGLPLCALAARQRNPWLDAWMKRQYGDIEVLDRDDRGVLAAIDARLKAGRAFAILPDLRVRKPDVAAPFFGGTANVSRAGAKFAVRNGSPIVVAAMARDGSRHVFRHLATLRPDPKAADGNEEARRLTREAMAILDADLRTHPGDWFWYNKRWILEPVRELKFRSSATRGQSLADSRPLPGLQPAAFAVEDVRKEFAS